MLSFSICPRQVGTVQLELRANASTKKLENGEIFFGRIQWRGETVTYVVHINSNHVL